MNFIRPGGRVWIGALLILSVGLALTSSCNQPSDSGTRNDAKGTVAEAEKFIAEAEKKLFDLNIKYSRADWVKSTYITDDTEALSADANKAAITATTELADQSRRFDGLDLPYDVARKMKLLKLALTLPAPKDPTERDEITKLAASLEGDYGKGKYCPEGDKSKCLGIDELGAIMATAATRKS